MMGTFQARPRGCQLLTFFIPPCTIIMAMATSQTSCLDCVSFASLWSCPFYDSSGEDDPDCVCVCD